MEEKIDIKLLWNRGEPHTNLLYPPNSDRSNCFRILLTIAEQAEYDKGKISVQLRRGKRRNSAQISEIVKQRFKPLIANGEIDSLTVCERGRLNFIFPLHNSKYFPAVTMIKVWKIFEILGVNKNDIRRTKIQTITYVRPEGLSWMPLTKYLKSELYNWRLAHWRIGKKQK